jgi:ElaB/YqjD/DUF883 family membrane-anchored ribosome-binding protein
MKLIRIWKQKPSAKPKANTDVVYAALKQLADATEGLLDRQSTESFAKAQDALNKARDILNGVA